MTKEIANVHFEAANYHFGEPDKAKALISRTESEAKMTYANKVKKYEMELNGAKM